MRRIVLVVLGFGVFAGFGSAFHHARWHGHRGGCDRRWAQHEESKATPAPQVFIIMPGAQPVAAAPQVVAIPQVVMVPPPVNP
jgi:hypothetical protein